MKAVRGKAVIEADKARRQKEQAGKVCKQGSGAGCGDGEQGFRERRRKKGFACDAPDQAVPENRDGAGIKLLKRLIAIGVKGGNDRSSGDRGYNAGFGKNAAIVESPQAAKVEGNRP